jgi:PAS domain S-box-containing protein
MKLSNKHISLLFLVWVFSSLSCGIVAPIGSTHIEKPVPTAVHGVLDLRNWDFVNDGVIRLNGEWGFFWKKQIDPKQGFQPDRFISVPGTWNAYDVNGQKTAGDGYATYTLKILLKPQQKIIGFKFPEISSAFTFFVNGIAIKSAGIPGKTPQTTQPCYDPGVKPYFHTTDEINILCHVSNFSHWEGGMWFPVMLGTHDQITNIQDYKRNLVLFLFGIIISMAFYHLGLFLIKTDDKAPLFLSLFSLCIGTRILSTDEIYLIHLFPGISWNFLLRTVYISFYLCILYFSLFTHSLFSEVVPKLAIRITNWVTIVFVIIVLVTKPRFFSYTMPVFQILTLILFIYGTLIYRRALISNRDTSTLYLIGFFVLVVSGTNDILYTRQIIHTGYFISYGLFGFMLTQSVLLVTRFSRVFNTINQQRKKLAETNVAYKKEIQERRKIAAELRESEKRYRLLAENASDIIWTLDLATFRYSYFSPSVYRMRGLKPEISVEQAVEEAISPRDAESMLSILAEELDRDQKSGVDPKRSKTVEYQHRHKDGSLTWVEAAMTFIRDDQGHPVEVLGVTRDISERIQAGEEKRLLEERLQQSKKLEAIATLAGGIAHQFNNALSSIIGRLELIEMELPGVRATGHLTPVKDMVDRMSTLTSQLLAYARGGKYMAKSVSLSHLANDSLPLVRHSVKPSVHIEKDLSQKTSRVMVDEPQMQMVLSAILSNASEAIDDKGRICISCKDVEVDEKISDGMQHLKPGRYVRLTIKDDGRGMDDVARDKIFEPFFSTKFQGRGLGMAAVYGIIKNHGGWIFVDSELGKETVINIYLPVIERMPNE